MDKDKVIQKLEDIVNWLSIRLNDLESYDKYNQLQSELSALKSAKEEVKSAEEILKDHIDTPCREAIMKENQFAKIKMAIASIQAVYLKMNEDKTFIEANPSNHRIAEYVQFLLNDHKHSESKEQWISVKDRLPEKMERVLCYNGFIVIEQSWCSYTNHDIDWFKKEFTHWMPLPEPPKS